MRLRMDSASIAGWKRAHELLGCRCGPELNHVAHLERYAETPPAEVGDLAASPSLWVVAERGGCGWHGFLRNGDMSLA